METKMSSNEMPNNIQNKISIDELLNDNSLDQYDNLKRASLSCQSLVDSIRERHGGELPKLTFKGKSAEEWREIKNREIKSDESQLVRP